MVKMMRRCTGFRPSRTSGKRPRDNDTHRIVHIGLFHLFDDGYRSDIGRFVITALWRRFVIIGQKLKSLLTGANTRFFTAFKSHADHTST